MTANPSPRALFAESLLQGRVALITGGGTGICRGIALAMASLGCDIAITSRSAEHLEPTARELADCGVRSLAVAGDVRKPDDVQQAVARTIDTFGRLDILVNGAAGNFVALAEHLGVRDRAARAIVGRVADSADAWIGELDALPFDGGVVSKLARVIRHRQELLRQA